MRRISPPAMERHETGGPGLFVSSLVEDLDWLIDEYAEQFQLIYLDPPFGTGEVFRIRTEKNKPVDLPIYDDTLSPEAYFSMLRKALLLCQKLLAKSGSLYLHIDYRMSAPLKLLLDDIFGPNNFMNEIIWAYRSGGRSKKHYPRKHDTILFYRKSPAAYFNLSAVGVPRGPERRNHMKRSVDETGRICFTIRSGGKTYTYYEDTPLYPTDVWTDIEHLHQRDPERTQYATQKPSALLARIILASSRPGDLVGDFFSGSGTTAATATAHGRRFLCVDCSPIAMLVLRRRMLEGCNQLSTFWKQAPFTLRYAASPEAHATLSAVAASVPGGHTITIQDYASSSPIGGAICYCALGRIVEGVFLPKAYAFAPAAPFTLSIEGGGPVVLQTAEQCGLQAFWQFD